VFEVDHAQRKGPGVQIDAAVKSVLSGLISDRGLFRIVLEPVLSAPKIPR
jgi:hypothetical protein